ncbi:hypothetical protein ANO11243_011690 [Dothideomycetidae sp. 11243]|nr:hypothetical protein ANO11243_011690 [fungal sp. No.11243]
MPTEATAKRCKDFIVSAARSESSNIRVIQFIPDPHKSQGDASYVLPTLCAVLFNKNLWPHAKAFWQHTGEGISSRRAEFCEHALHEGRMVEKSTTEDPLRMKKGPRRYQRQLSKGSVEEDSKDGDASEKQTNGNIDAQDPAQFVEERFGRNLSVTLAEQAKLAIRRRIAGSLSSDMDLHDALQQPEEVEKVRAKDGFSVDDVLLYPGGMNSIFHAHRTLMLARGPQKSIMYGFPYVDTLKVLEKFGPGALFYGHGSAQELDDLESRLQSGERFLALFCEFPGNPLLKTPDLKRIRRLADTYDFAIVVDETIGNFLNVHVLPDADIVVSSLTKIFSGDSNVMGGSAVLNPSSRYYTALKSVYGKDYSDTLFEEDALFLERNSRDFVSRIVRINTNADAIADILAAHVPTKVKQVNYPRSNASREYYDAYRLPNAGYGGLLSCTFHDLADAEAFYDALETAKGPSLGTNFTLSSPFVLLAHYTELEWAAEYGCEASLVRFSVGLEDVDDLRQVFQRALIAVPERQK